MSHFGAVGVVATRLDLHGDHFHGDGLDGGATAEVDADTQLALLRIIDDDGDEHAAGIAARPTLDAKQLQHAARTPDAGGVGDGDDGDAVADEDTSDLAPVYSWDAADTKPRLLDEILTECRLFGQEYTPLDWSAWTFPVPLTEATAASSSMHCLDDDHERHQVSTGSDTSRCDSLSNCSSPRQQWPAVSVREKVAAVQVPAPIKNLSVAAPEFRPLGHSALTPTSSFSSSTASLAESLVSSAPSSAGSSGKCSLAASTCSSTSSLCGEQQPVNSVGAMPDSMFSGGGGASNSCGYFRPAMPSAAYSGLELPPARQMSPQDLPGPSTGWNFKQRTAPSGPRQWSSVRPPAPTLEATWGPSSFSSSCNNQTALSNSTWMSGQFPQNAPPVSATYVPQYGGMAGNTPPIDGSGYNNSFGVVDGAPVPQAAATMSLSSRPPSAKWMCGPADLAARSQHSQHNSWKRLEPNFPGYFQWSSQPAKSVEHYSTGGGFELYSSSSGARVAMHRHSPRQDAPYNYPADTGIRPAATWYAPVHQRQHGPANNNGNNNSNLYPN